MPNAAKWLPTQHDLPQPDTWTVSRLAAFRQLRNMFFDVLRFLEWASPHAPAPDTPPAPAGSQHGPKAPTLQGPLLNLLETLQVQLVEEGARTPGRT